MRMLQNSSRRMMVSCPNRPDDPGRRQTRIAGRVWATDSLMECRIAQIGERKGQQSAYGGSFLGANTAHFREF